MSAATTTSTRILHHTTTFLSETLSQTHTRHHLYSTFLKQEKLPTPLLKSLTFVSQTIENAISTTSPSLRTSSLRLAEKLLLSNPGNDNNAFSPFLLSLVYHLSNRALDAALSLLDLFEKEPSLSRLEIAPFLFQELFLVHFSEIVEWYNVQRSKILFSVSLNSGYDDGDNKAIVSSESLLSNMSAGQASALKDLERDYEVLLEDNLRIFVRYFKELVRNHGGKETNFPPTIVFNKTVSDDQEPLTLSDEENVNIQGFDSSNRRYNPIWNEGGGDRSFESDSIDSKRVLSKFPSLFPVRVSPKVLMNQISSPNNDINRENSTDYSSEAEAEAEEKKENIKELALFDSSKRRQQQQHRQNQRSPDASMEEVGGKHSAPKDFVCPITTHVFDDPVTLETGQTYERRAIQEWLDRGNSNCPITRQNLHSSQLPKTNYVLKRLIASWREHNQVMMVDHDHSAFSPKSVISQATGDGTMAELRLAITDLCTSEVLREAEMAVLRIERCWREAMMEEKMLVIMLAKPPVVNGFVEMLLNSVDTQVLRATVYLLTELGSRDESVVQTMTRVDSDVDSIVHLLKKGLPEAVVLVYLLRHSALSLVDMELADSLLEMLDSKGEDDTTAAMKMFMEPKTAAVLLLAGILRTCTEDTSIARIVTSIVSTRAIETIVAGLKAQQSHERVAAVSILLRCLVEDGKCRNMVAEKAELGGLLEILPQVSDKDGVEIIHFFSELAKLNRRHLNEQMLHSLKDEGSFSTRHTLLIYLQNSPPDHSPVVAGLLLQLDLLEEPRKMSIYREEAIDTLISCLRNSGSPAAQICAAETILSLQGSFSYSGKSLSRAILLKRAGLNRSYVAFMRRDQRRHNISAMEEDEKAAEEWEKKVAFFLVSHEFGLLFEALAQGLKSNYEDLNSVCFMAATWLIYMLSVLPDTGIRGAARVCLLNHFVSIFKSEKNVEDRALSMLGLNSFIRDTEGLQDLANHTKDILKGLRELKKFSTVAFEMLQVFSEEHENSADIWSHRELTHQDCSVNGEVVALTCFKGKLYSGHSDGTIKVWSARGPELRLIQEIREHTKAVTSLTVLQSSEKLYSGSLDRTVRIWSVAEEGIYCEQVEEVKDQIINLVVASNIACFIPQGAGVKVHSWNGSSKLLNQHKYAKCLALVHGKLYCGCQDNSIQEIDLVTGTLANIQTGSKKLIGKANPIYTLQVDDGLLYAASPSFDGANVKIWSTSNYGLVGSLSSTLDVRSMAVSTELIYLGSKVGTIEVWCKKKHNRVETLQTNLNSKIICMALDTDQDMLFIGTSDGRIQTWGLG